MFSFSIFQLSLWAKLKKRKNMHINFQYSWQRGPNPCILWRPPILPTRPFSNFVQLLLSCHPQTPHPLLFLLSCFFGSMGNQATFNVLLYLYNDIMTLHMYLYVCTLKYLDVCFPQQGIKFTEESHIMCFFAASLIYYHSHTNTLTQRYTAHSEASRLTHPYKYIFIPLAMCSQQ